MLSHPVTVGELLIGFAALALGYAALVWWTTRHETQESTERLEAMGETYEVTHKGPHVVDLQKR